MRRPTHYRLRTRSALADRISKKSAMTSPGEAEWPHPPRGLEVSNVALNDEQYIVLSFPIPRWNLPPALTSAEKDVATALLGGKTSEEIAAARRTSIDPKSG